MQNYQNVCYHPTTVFAVDDNKKFFNVIKLAVNSKNTLCQFSDNSQQALQFLKNTYTPDPFTNRCIKEPEDQSIDKRHIEVDIRAIRREIFIPTRYQQISVVILDFAMPGLNGGEIAKELKHKPFKIILLTGEADANTAINLFNQGIIHAYVRKDDPDFNNVLNNTILNLQHVYFHDLSLPIINSLAGYPDSPHYWYKDPLFKQLFAKICLKNKIIEYYLLDEFGSFLLLDDEAQPGWLAVANDALMATYLEFAEDDNASAEIIIELKNKSMLPFFFSDDDLSTRPSDWQSYLHKASMLQGQENYYYSYISNHKAYDIENKIFSLKNLDLK